MPAAPLVPSRHPRRGRARTAALLVALAVQALVLYLPVVPDAPGTSVPGADKITHAAVFALVTVAGLVAGLPPAIVVGFGVVHAAASELVQHSVLPGRSGDVLDVVADLAGVALGVVVARWLARRRS
ncbi:VanZ family protein [Georgenia yuyongxinii]|uniref:VanZ family protein n=1 Tax=Georgenia yuyongxinii TaxID=2589797 RepID=A0A552WKZ1_9MICO|nr:VanZ family protein [Georgenia yuyongxinii]TRW43417.1 VanZ family protein [Georgenia yuyongxinii]